MKTIELFYAPRTKVKEYLNARGGGVNDWIEMSEFESAFLCGLIKERQPSKILEVGVAEGGTTAVIMQCLSLLNYDESCQVYSVDLAERFYRDSEKQTGFIWNQVKSVIKKRAAHKLLLGKILPERLDEIGGGIDFVILDTMHITPGELLDFLAVFPYLTSNACVVLHDIHMEGGETGYVTQLLLDVVVGDKIIMKDPDRICGYPNIGAFLINKDTGNYIEDCFHALSLPWYYMPDSRHIREYRKNYEKYYGKELAELFDIMVGIHREKYSGCDYTLGERILFTPSNSGTRYFLFGISPSEGDFAWSSGSGAKACFKLSSTELEESFLITIRFKYIFNQKQRIIIFCDGDEIYNEEIPENKDRILVNVLKEYIRNNTLELDFEFPDACSPKELGQSDDARKLAFAFSEMLITM